MKLVSFEHEGRETFGVAEDGMVLIPDTLSSGASTLADALRLDGLEAIARAARRSTASVSLDSVRLLPPIPRPGKIICVGLNYKTHIAESGHAAPEWPMLFARFANSLVGHGQNLVRPGASASFDFEGELAFVIGRPARHVGRAEALSHVAGYTCFNDGSLRDYQIHTSQFLPGKTFWRSGSCGPWLVTADEIPDPAALTLTTRLNGEVMQHAPTDDLLFDVPALIAYLSTITELEPGDLVATGTTGGVGLARQPQVWMKPGDHVEVEIDRIGVLSNHVVDAEVAP